MDKRIIAGRTSVSASFDIHGPAAVVTSGTPMPATFHFRNTSSRGSLMFSAPHIMFAHRTPPRNRASPPKKNVLMGVTT